MIQGFISPQALALMFLFFGLTIAVIIKNIRAVYSWVPYTPSLFIISIALGYTCEHTGVIGQSLKQISNIDPHGILLIFLPPLIFESSFNSDWYIFRKQSVQIFILAFPAVLVGALIIMFCIKMVICYDQSYYNWPEAFMFASVLSCTDTVAVLALLKEAGAPRKFSSLIEGESLFNDGSCMVLFTISIQLVKGNSPPVHSIIRLFMQLTLGAIVLGVLFGYVSSRLINRVRNDPILTLNITVVSCYLVYFVAQYVDLGIKISGIMALVSLGLYMAAFGKTKISPDANEIIQNFWKIYVFIAETTIFILGGVVVGTQALKLQFVQIMDQGNIKNLLYLYICMTFARFLSISVFMPKLKSQGYGLKWNQVVALTYGGLRGAVGIAFTLILASNDSLKQKFRLVSLFNTSGCAFLTLVINAPTCSLVIRKLGLCVKSDTKIRFFRKFMKQCHHELNQQLEQMKKKRHVQNSNWEKVKQNSGIIQLKSFISTTTQSLKQLKPEDQKRVNSQRSSLEKSLLDPSLQDIHCMYGINQQINPALMAEIRNRFCVILKGILWDKFQSNQCSSESIRVLLQCVNIDMDCIQQPLNSWDYLISHLHNPFFFPICFWLKKKPIIGPIAFSWMYDRVNLLYDVISTYLDALQECENACRQLPFDEYLQARVIQQSSQNKKLAQSFLDHEIKISYFQIMKRIQTTKAAQSIISYCKQIINNSFNYGQIDDLFNKMLIQIFQANANKLQADSQAKQEMNDLDIMKQSQFFRQLSQQQIKRLLLNKIDLFVQKDEPVLRSYQKQKYVYLVVRGEVIQQYRVESKTVYRRNIGLYQLTGLGTVIINRRVLQYSATAQSVVSIFCFPIGQIKELMSKKPKFQELLQVDLFMLQVKLQPQIERTLAFGQQDWRRKKHLVSYKRLLKGQTFTIQNSFLILIFGKLSYNNNNFLQGCFEIRQKAVIQGPSKFYNSSLSILIYQQENKQQRVSLSRPSKYARVSNINRVGSAIIDRAIFKKD